MTIRRLSPSHVRIAPQADGAEQGVTPSRLVTVTVSTETLGRDDIVVVSGGIDLTNFRANPIVMWQHDPAMPVGRAIEIGVIGSDLVATVEFAPEGVSQHADTVYGLIKAGIINAASTGFETREAEPIDPAKPREGLRITACELQEFSFVSIPAVPDALITERALQEVRTRMTEKKQPDSRIEIMKCGLIKRGLYEVSNFACLLAELGWLKSNTEWEAGIEQDGSTVPAQLGEAMKALGECLISMTAEEVNELLGGPDIDAETPEEVEIVTQSASPAIARFRIGLRRARPPAVEVQKPSISRAKTSPVTRRRMAALYERELSSAA